MTLQDKQRFYRAFQAMEDEGEVEPLEPELQERLVQSMLAERRRRPPTRYWAVAGLVALAACLALVFGLRRPSAELPQYALYAAGDEQKMGPSAVGTSVKLAEDSILSLAVRPWEPVPGEVTTRAFLHRNGQLQPWSMQLQALPSGAFQVQAPAHELGLTAGSWEIIVVIGRGTRVPANQQIQKVLGAASPTQPARIDTWQVLRLPIEILKR